MSTAPESSSYLTDHWAAALGREWPELAGSSLSPLPGEFDLNYRVLVDGQFTHVLKVMRPGCAVELVDMQCRLHAHLAGVGVAAVPQILAAADGELWAELADPDDAPRLVWVIEAAPGFDLHQVSVRSGSTFAALGAATAALANGLASFDHPHLDRPFRWRPTDADWVRASRDLFADDDERALVDAVMDRYDSGLAEAIRNRPQLPIHNDLNDHNVLVQQSATRDWRVSGIIDFGDCIRGATISELAVAAAYALMGAPRPIEALTEMVRGFHAVRRLDDADLELLFSSIQLRLAMSVANSATRKRDHPDDPYVVVSEAPAWALLRRLEGFDETLTTAQLRVACGLAATPSAHRIAQHLDDGRGSFAAILPSLGDLSVAPPTGMAVSDGPFPADPFALTDSEAEAFGVPGATGGWGEPRLVYTEPAFLEPLAAGESSPVRRRRTVHLGVDVMGPAGTPVHAPAHGIVHCAEARPARLDYGAVVILEHQTDAGDPWYSLYGHLAAPSIAGLAPGSRVQAGDQIAELGDPSQNGGWAPHLHLQVAVTTDGMDADWPGACLPEEWATWQELCPNPAALLSLPDEAVAWRGDDLDELAATRDRHFARNLKLSYDEPLQIARGWQHYLFDPWGRVYLDAYNNVPHVGHAHPRIAAVADRQLRMLNTNSRYLHESQTGLAQELTARLPEGLDVCFLVNSASEANEVALRLADGWVRSHEVREPGMPGIGAGMAGDVIVQAHGYHGITTGALALSHYKFAGRGGTGPEDWVHVVDVPDTYRGKYRGSHPKAGFRYAAGVGDAVRAAHLRGRSVAAFVAETFPSVGGQLIPPPGYLAEVYRQVRAAGGLCVADEVQTGLGRLGEYYWGFEHQKVVPDVVVVGKPLGNGHPVAAVVTTREVADALAPGMEFFSTFGGSTLSCAIATEVLRITDEEALPQNAQAMGERLLTGLREIGTRHREIGDVRGLGLFWGVEIVHPNDDGAPGEPDPAFARWIKNALRHERVLIGTDGPHDNVLKIRPPLTIGPADIDCILARLAHVLRAGAGPDRPS